MIAEVKEVTGEVRTHVWGADLSGTLQGAGGVGGLLMTFIINGPNAGVYFPVDDGNGNVMGYVRGADGLLAAQYEYGPFGELLRATGPLSQTFNPLFSTKYLDWETGLYYYGHRYYNPTTGRWLSRDPIGERGGRNLYGFNYNNPIQFYDPDGRNPAVLVIGGVTVTVGECVLLAVTTCMAIPPCRDALIEVVRSGVRELGDCIGKCRPKRKRCRPCIPPVGTIAGEVQTGHDHWPITGPHIHFFEMHQVPIGTPPPGEECRCFWKRDALPPVPGTTLPPGIPPVAPAAGGGVEYY